MPKAPAKWVEEMPTFLGLIESASDEGEIRKACEHIKQVVVESYPTTPSSRRKPMNEIRKAIRERYPAQKGKSIHETPSFPYYFTNTGKGSIPRWEHLAINYLNEEWNQKKDEEVVKESKPVVVKTEFSIFDYVGLSGDELEAVKTAIGEAEIKDWVRQAMLQRANAINALNERLDEDLSMVPSEQLMNDKKYRTNPNACRELTSRAVRAIKDWNYNHPEHKWCITNKLISQLTGNTVKAIARAVEGMDIDSYNSHHDLQPVNNRLTKAAVGDISENVSIKDVLGIDE